MRTVCRRIYCIVLWALTKIYYPKHVCVFWRLTLLDKVPLMPKCSSALSFQVLRSLQCHSARLPKCRESQTSWVPSVCKCLRTLSVRVPSDRSSARVLSNFFQCLTGHWVHLNALYLTKFLIRYDWKKILNIKRCFMCTKVDQM